jgi:hypothetical protein
MLLLMLNKLLVSIVCLQKIERAATSCMWRARFMLMNFWQKRPPPPTDCQKRPPVRFFVKKDPLLLAASLANWHVAHAAIARADMYLPPGTEPTRCLTWAMPPESDPTRWGGRWTSMACWCHVSDPGNMLTPSQAASTCRLCQWRHVSRVSWLDLPPPRGGLFWQKILQVVFFNNPLAEVVFS